MCWMWNICAQTLMNVGRDRKEKDELITFLLKRRSFFEIIYYSSDVQNNDTVLN